MDLLSSSSPCDSRRYFLDFRRLALALLLRELFGFSFAFYLLCENPKYTPLAWMNSLIEEMLLHVAFWVAFSIGFEADGLIAKRLCLLVLWHSAETVWRPLADLLSHGASGRLLDL
jgi:hypothetical protein